MPSSAHLATPACSAAIIFVLLFPLHAWAQASGRVLHSFDGRPDCGPLAHAALLAGPGGHLFGSTDVGGSGGLGCIFELSPSPTGWHESVLHSFSGPDGNGPTAALTLDAAGNLYGTTVDGGTYNGGVAFELSPARDGSWNETVLYNFGNGDDAADPECDLIFDRRGNLYGTTGGGGPHNTGTIFRLSPSQGGWVESILYEFQDGIGGPGGAFPVGGLVMDRVGRLYGVTSSGGEYGSGAAYELVPENGAYKEKIIHSFGAAGVAPNSGLTMDSNGNLYGTTSFGGTIFAGTVYELTKGTGGMWTEQTLQSMEVQNGVSPNGPVVFDKAGNLYATAFTGGINDMGSVFMLSPTKNGQWIETVLHRFNFKYPDGEDGEHSEAGVIIVDGKVFGTTTLGGIYNDGIVFEGTSPADFSVSSLDAAVQ